MPQSNQSKHAATPASASKETVKGPQAEPARHSPRTKLPTVPSAEAKHYMSRLRKELRAVARRNEKLKSLEERLEEQRLKRDARFPPEPIVTAPGATSEDATTPTESEVIELGAFPGAKVAAPQNPVKALKARKLERLVERAQKRPMDPETKVLQADVRRQLDEVAHAVTRVVSSRLALSIGDGENLGKIDLITDERAYSPKPTREHDKETLGLVRLLYEVLDSSMHELEQALRAQYKRTFELKINVALTR